MLFSSVTFLFFFLPVVLVLYYIIPAKGKNIVLLIASLVFYAWGEPVYVALLLLSVCLNYFCGREIQAGEDDPRRAKRSVIFAVVANILILGFFKYYGFLLDMLSELFSADIPYRVLPLPIGISFYTFQALSYVVDIYRKKVKAQNNILSFALYICMFPKLIAGPVVRYADFEQQLTERRFSVGRIGQGSRYFIIGLAKKAILANTAGAIFEQISAGPASSMSALTAWIGCISFAFQIYFDFSGYSDMAVGLGKMFGFEFRKNFDYPYTATSIADFWRRWHISLTNWFREYVYIPLGGNQCSPARNVLNIMIVWTLTGMWHGAAWNFIVWGVYYGIILVMEKYVWGVFLDEVPKVVARIYTGVLVLVGWVFFFSPSLGYSVRYLMAMIGAGAGLADAQGGFLLITHWLLYLLAVLCSGTVGIRLFRGITGISSNRKVRAVTETAVYMIMFFVSVAFLVTDTYNPFLYFRF